jgi:hypothetical protein
LKIAKFVSISNIYDHKEKSLWFLSSPVAGTKKLEYMAMWEAPLLEFKRADNYIQNGKLLVHM